MDQLVNVGRGKMRRQVDKMRAFSRPRDETLVVLGFGATTVLHVHGGGVEERFEGSLRGKAGRRPTHAAIVRADVLEGYRMRMTKLPGIIKTAA